MQLNHLLLHDDHILKAGTFLLLFNVYHRPPHIALSIDGKYYSLSVKGVESGRSMQTILRNVHIRRTPSLFIQLKPSSNNILPIFQSYPLLDTGVATCLSPIKDFCKQAYGTEVNHINYVFELLPRLVQQHIVGQCYSLYLHQQDAQQFKLLTYNMDDINNSIRRNRLEIADSPTPRFH